MPLVKYRLHGHRFAPQPIQLPIPGWGGEPQPRADGSHEQVWHCTPFSEGARYGVEVLYPFDEELRVTQVARQGAARGRLGRAGRSAP